MRNRLVAGACALSLLLPGVAAAADGYPRTVEKGDQLCLQNLDAEGVVQESCMDKAPTHVDLGIRRAGAYAAETPNDAAEALSWASVKYSWSAGFKGAAIVGGLAGTILLVESLRDEDVSSGPAWSALAGGGLCLLVGLLIDGSAARDVEQARRQLGR